MKWNVKYQQMGFKPVIGRFSNLTHLAKWLLNYPEGNAWGVKIISIWGPTK